MTKRTITTLKTRLLLTENNCTTAPIIENNNDEMSTRIQNNRLLIETVLLQQGKVEAQLELNTIHQQIMRKPEATCTENSRPYIGRSIGKTNNKELLIEVTSPEHRAWGKHSKDHYPSKYEQKTTL